MGDVIDRQAAIEALEREKTYCTAFRDGYTPTDCFKQYNMGLVDGIKALTGLPSAQPDLDEWCTDCKEYDQEKHCCPRWNRVIRNALKDAQPEPRWIPVTERLPKIDMTYPHHDDYLVQYDSGNMDVASWSNVNRFWTDHVTEPHWNCVQFAIVVAWMPLPEPYREETENE